MKIGHVAERHLNSAGGRDVPAKSDLRCRRRAEQQKKGFGVKWFIER